MDQRRLGQRGISLLEVLLGGTIAAIAYVGVVKIATNLTKKTTEVRSTQSADVEVERAFRTFSRQVYNSAFILPAEGLLAAGDSRYNGLAGINGADLSVPNCKFAVGAGTDETASILRFTQLMDKIRPERVVQVFSETDIATKPLRLSLPDTSAGALPIASPRGPNTTELVVLDADNVDMRRYAVISSRIDTSRATLPFDHLTLTLAMPPTATGIAQPPIARNFITDSVAFAASTKYSCLSEQGQWIVRDSAGTEESLLKLSIEGMQIERLEFRYHGSKSSERLEPSLFTLYPYASVNSALCVNTIQVRLQVKETKTVAKKTKDYSTTVLMHNFQMRRPIGCDP